MTVAVGRGGVVASGHPAVSHAAVEVLRAGGNAVDAAVAGMFVSFHAEPLLTSAAGAGFAVALVDGERLGVDFFSAAPGLGGDGAPWVPPEGCFYGLEVDFGSAKQVFHIGAGSVAVPGAVPGLLRMQSSAGRLGLRAVLAPAREVCANGSLVTPMGAFATRILWPIVSATGDLRSTFVGADGRPLGDGATYRNPDMGRFLDAVARYGEDVFARGPVADALLACVMEEGGGLTAEDLAAYRVRVTEPVSARMGDAELLLAPPPSVAGMWLALVARLLADQPATAPGSIEEALLLRAVFTVANRTRQEVCGDETPTEAHAALMLDPARVAGDRAEVVRLLALGPAPLPEGRMNRLGGTTHLSVIDRWGNACAITVSNGECSGLVLPDHGVFLNNFLGEEDVNPQGFHRYVPGARLGSGMCPMVVRRDDGTVMALGSGGSNRIRTALLQVTRHLLVHGASPEAAVGADRLHVEPGRLYAEAERDLKGAVGHLSRTLEVGVFAERNMFFGGTHLAVRLADGTCVGVGDDRRSGHAVTLG